jgi:hypothetical protein
MLTELKGRYNILVKHLQDVDGIDERFKCLRPRRPILTGIDTSRMNKGTIGYNVNKGYEICICLAGDDINSAFYVLLHELAHMTVTEYDHTTKFWTNFKDLKALCNSLGIYDNSSGSSKYCGDSVVRS